MLIPAEYRPPCRKKTRKPLNVQLHIFDDVPSKEATVLEGRETKLVEICVGLTLLQGDYTVYTESQDKYIVRVQQQNQQRGTDRPNAYLSWSLKKAERAYD